MNSCQNDFLATIKDVKVQGSTIKAVAYDCANSEGFDAVLTKKSWVDKPENYVKVARYQDAKTITFTNVKNGTYYLGIHAYNRDYYDGKVSGKRFGAWSYPVEAFFYKTDKVINCIRCNLRI